MFEVKYYPLWFIQDLYLFPFTGFCLKVIYVLFSLLKSWLAGLKVEEQSHAEMSPRWKEHVLCEISYVAT